MQVGAQLTRAPSTDRLDPDAVAEADLARAPERKIVVALDRTVRRAAADRFDVVRPTLAIAHALKV
jgi:hypothetical protein